MKRISLIMLVGGVVMTASGCFAASLVLGSQVDDRITKSFVVQPGGRLTVVVDRGAIFVKTADTETVVVEVIREAEARSLDEAEAVLEDHVVDFTHTGSDVSIQSEYPSAKQWWRRQKTRLHVEFHITVPRQYDVDLETKGASIRVDDLEGEVRSKTAGGSLYFGHIQGSVTGLTAGGSIELDGSVGNANLKTAGGSIRIGEVEGDVTATTAGGSIEIERAKGRVVAKTVGGSIRVEEVLGAIEAVTAGGSVWAAITEQPEADCSLRTAGGNVTVRLAPHIAVTVDAKTSGGRVVTEVPVTVEGTLSRSALKGTLNGGGPTLVLRTSGGSIYLRE